MLPTLLVSHGATIFTAAEGDPTRAWLASLAGSVLAARPRAIVVVSAHFVTPSGWAVTSSAAPGLVHDHPVAALHGERYAPPGDPALAEALVAALQAAGLAARADARRGLDHGAWLPLRAMVPGAELPIVMMSVNAAASPAEHVAAGTVLAGFRRRGVMVLASGGVTHNQEEFRRGFLSGAAPTGAAPAWSVAFDAWVTRTVAIPDRASRVAALAGFEEHPDYRRAHPTAEHFWPVLVAVGAGGEDAGRRVHAGFQHGLSMSAFRFGELPGS